MESPGEVHLALLVLLSSEGAGYSPPQWALGGDGGVRLGPILLLLSAEEVVPVGADDHVHFSSPEGCVKSQPVQVWPVLSVLGPIGGSKARSGVTQDGDQPLLPFFAVPVLHCQLAVLGFYFGAATPETFNGQSLLGSLEADRLGGPCGQGGDA